MKLCPHRQRLMYFFPAHLELQLLDVNVRGALYCGFEKRCSDIYNIVFSMPPASFLPRTMKCHPCAVLSQLLVHPHGKLEQGSDLV